ncbi:type IV toxin-antitoxin system AbiEi family antitoxin domain-containing protein [Shewanella sp. 202IG2-18]|uniref:type IV toxin-antitoxin system AbiEi family antitoxin n=1 Tax=Parashewanella hymeniacidonis TaxID=2807618 RepID=UPI001961CCE2|nr:type IV toxin-antitoxin system AbiEi family antitoxin domain-containing protein [Parashewanella hymeniacidonis]MBM7070747.1 type IV toxin-antitoxin system AbiEi family antitoxin domain-containing protein [Parashewanella hymeniacidonis]
MRQELAISRLNDLDSKGHYVFLHRDLAKIFHEDSIRSLNDSLARFAKTGLLERVARGVYVYGFSRNKHSSKTIEYIATALRRGAYNYISLESALSSYGVISQIPVDRLTLMTTGVKGIYKTNYGVIEFTHTKRTIKNILNQVIATDSPLRVASKMAALRDLKRVGRNIHLVDMEAMADD